MEPIDRYAAHLRATVAVRGAWVRASDATPRFEHGLFAVRDLAVGDFVGFYSGRFAQRVDDGSQLAYAMEVGPPPGPTVHPFADEDRITEAEREAHPLASANEPPPGVHANVHAVLQDFASSEILWMGEKNEGAFGTARFARGVGVFAAEAIEAGSELFLHYGSSYQPIRDLKGYEVGEECRLVVDGVDFIEPNCHAVLATLSRVPARCVYPVCTNVASDRFRPPKRVRIDSEGEESVCSSSGEDHEPYYRPRPTSRPRALFVAKTPSA